MGQDAIGSAECREDSTGVEEIEEIHRRRVISFEEPNLQLPHQHSHAHPEAVAQQEDRLKVLAVAVTKGRDQLWGRLDASGVQPLLELVEDQQDLADGRAALTGAVKSWACPTSAFIPILLRLFGRR